MLNSAFDAFTDVRTDYYPAELRPEIDRINELVYSTVNNGVYRGGFATTQLYFVEKAASVVCSLHRRIKAVSPHNSRRQPDCYSSLWHCSRCKALFESFPRFPPTAKSVRETMMTVHVFPPLNEAKHA